MVFLSVVNWMLMVLKILVWMARGIACAIFPATKSLAKFDLRRRKPVLISRRGRLFFDFWGSGNGCQMKLRSARERAIQTTAYEIGGLAVVTPLYGLITGHTGMSSLVLLMCVAITCLAWAAIHNTAFDWVEARVTGRVASDRPQRLRLIHAASHEVSSIIASTPVIMLVAGIGLWPAFLTDVGLTLAYTAYAYIFHIAYDRLRPVADDKPPPRSHMPAFPRRPRYHEWPHAKVARYSG
jgi:uncharacterized membrane protein